MLYSYLNLNSYLHFEQHTVYPKKYAHGFCFAALCCGYTLTDFPVSIRLTSLALWQSNDCPSASKANLINMDKYFMWIHYERLHNHNKAKQNKTVCIFLGIYCKSCSQCYILSQARHDIDPYWLATGSRDVTAVQTWWALTTSNMGPMIYCMLMMTSWHGRAFRLTGHLWRKGQ